MVLVLAVPGWGLVSHAHESGGGLLDNRIGELELRGGDMALKGAQRFISSSTLATMCSSIGGEQVAGIGNDGDLPQTVIGGIDLDKGAACDRRVRPHRGAKRRTGSGGCAQECQ